MSVNTIDHERLALASVYAKMHSGCTKVAVGSIIYNGKIMLSAGANKTDLNLCKSVGCLRLQRYGDNGKAHRNPDDCRAIHSEIDAIAQAGQNLMGAAIYVTRYPCEACARAIVAAGISTVVYGRKQKVSPMTQRIFEGNNVDVIHIWDYEEDDVTT